MALPFGAVLWNGAVSFSIPFRAQKSRLGVFWWNLVEILFLSRVTGSPCWGRKAKVHGHTGALRYMIGIVSLNYFAQRLHCTVALRRLTQQHSAFALVAPVFTLWSACQHRMCSNVDCASLCCNQGAPWSWKVMEFRKTIFQAWKVMENSKGHGKVIENDDNVMEFLLLHWAIL